MQALVYNGPRPSLPGIFVAHIRDGKEATNGRAGQLFQRLGIRHDMHAATQQQVSAHCLRRGMGPSHRPVICQPRATFEEEVV